MKAFKLVGTCILIFSCLNGAQAQTTELPIDLIPRVNARNVYESYEPYVIGSAFYNSGFTVLMDNGDHRKGKNGIYVHEWNLKVLSPGVKNNSGVKLRDFILAWQLAATAKGNVIDNAPLDPKLLELFLADLKAAFNLPRDEETGRRRLAHSIVALGRMNPFNPYDLVADNVSPDVQLNVLQLALLTQKMSADLWVLARKQHPEAAGLPKNNFLNSADSSCVMTDTEGLIFDTTSILSGPFVSGFFDYLSSMKFVSEVGVERYAKITGVANVVLNYVKFAWSMAAFDAKLESDKNPLERTRTKTPGENAIIFGSFKMDGSSLQVINCLRPALNAAGLDFSLPQGGPLAGVLVEWQIATKTGSANDVVQTYGVDPLRQETDKDGLNQITVQGKPQKKDLSQAEVVDVERIVPIIATVNLKNKNPGQDAVDLFSLIGGISSLWSQPLEILNRAPLIFSRRLNLAVNDVKELEGDLFVIEGVYEKPLEMESGENAYLKNIKDNFLLTTEVKVAGRTVTTDLLTAKDRKATYISEYPADYNEGEGCRVQQSPVGNYEAFLMNKKSIEISGSSKREADGTITAKVAVKLKGDKLNRGFKFKTGPQCPIPNTREELIKDAHSLEIAFDSKQLNQVGQSITIDRRTDGEGWIFTVTYQK